MNDDVTADHEAKSVTHRAGHWPKLHPDCDTCESIFATRQADIFAAARVIRDSERIKWEDKRAALAMAYVQDRGAEYATGQHFDDAYQGCWDNFSDYVEDLLDSTGALEGMPDNLKYYFDTEKFARDLILGGDYTTVDLPDYRVAVFDNHC